MELTVSFLVRIQVGHFAQAAEKIGRTIRRERQWDISTVELN